MDCAQVPGLLNFGSQVGSDADRYKETPMDEQALLAGISYEAQVVARGTAGYINVGITVEETSAYEAELAVAEIGFGPHEILTAEKVGDGLMVVTVRLFFVLDGDPS